MSSVTEECEGGGRGWKAKALRELEISTCEELQPNFLNFSVRALVETKRPDRARLSSHSKIEDLANCVYLRINAEATRYY
jgi:hypothetical protein